MVKQYLSLISSQGCGFTYKVLIGLYGEGLLVFLGRFFFFKEEDSLRLALFSERWQYGLTSGNLQS